MNRKKAARVKRQAKSAARGSLQKSAPSEGRSLPKNTPDIITCIDEAGDTLIHIRKYKDALELYRAAAARFPKTAAFHQGVLHVAGAPLDNNSRMGF